MASKRTTREVAEQEDYADRRPDGQQQQLDDGGSGDQAADPDAESIEEDLSDTEQAALDNIDVDENVTDDEAEAVKESVGAALATGAVDTDAVEQVEVTREDEESGEGTTVEYAVTEDDSGDVAVANEDQEFSFATQENPTGNQVDRATARFAIASNGVDIGDHETGEQFREDYHENGEPTYTDDQDELEDLHAEITNEDMAGEGWEDLTEAANESLDLIHESDGVESFTNTRGNTGYEAVNGREVIAQSQEAMNDDNPGHAAELVAYHPELAAATADTFGASDEQKKMLKWADDNLDNVDVDSEAISDVNVGVADENQIKAHFKQAKALGANLEDGFIADNFRGPMGR